MDKVTVVHGDTDLVPVGTGTYASRSLQLGGSAVYKAAVEVKDEARRQAADMLEASEADVVLDTATGLWQVRGDPATSLSSGQVAGHTSGGSLIADVSFSADLDNEGSRATGEYRAGATLRMNSPFSRGDNLDLRLFNSFGKGLSFGRVSYETPRRHWAATESASTLAAATSAESMTGEISIWRAFTSAD